jgi:hypothetical protein
MKLSKFVIILILNCAVITAFYSFSSSLSDEYGVSTPESDVYESKYNKLDDIFPHINSTYEDTVGINPESDLQFFTGVWDTFRTTKEFVKAMFSIPKNMLSDITKDMGLPRWVYSVFWGIISVVIIATLLTILINRDW